MAAYASLLSLTTLLDHIKIHTRHPIHFPKEQDESLRHHLAFFLHFLETYSHMDTQQLRDLEIRILQVANEAEDVIELHVVDQIQNGSSSDSKANFKFLHPLQKVIGDMESIEKEAREIQGMNEVEHHHKLLKHSRPVSSSSRVPPSGKNDMVGFDKEREQIMERLTCQNLSRFIPIVGMGGSGKTTLAKSVFDEFLVVRHFDVRIWITVSQEYTPRSILLQIPICQEKQNSSKDFVPDGEIGEALYKSLIGRRYLFVLDDLWNVEAWDGIRQFFPDDDKTSRIILTTRLSNVAAYFGSTCAIPMNFLDPDQSWRLFCKNAFARKACPSELVNIGKEIVRKCRGLPLSITVIGRLLATSSWEKKYWKDIAEDINLVLNSEDGEYCLNVLSLSYKYLPIHLKPCFLYMGIFPEDFEIYCDNLIKLWVAEGFLRFDENKSLEEIAEGYLQDLVDRNLILIGRKLLNRKMNTCYIHDLLRDLCQRQAQKERFYCVLRSRDILYSMYCVRRIVFHGCSRYQVIPAMQLAPFARSVICTSGKPSFRSSLLRILDAYDIDSIEDIFQQINLRYVSLSRYLPSTFKFPSSLSFLWNLQTLKCPNFVPISAPSEIWDMQQLRHIEFTSISLPEPLGEVNGHGVVAMENLQTLSRVVNFTCSKEVLKRIPNVKKLDISYHRGYSKEDLTWLPCCLQKLCCLHKLEILSIALDGMLCEIEWIQNLKLPNSLKELKLMYCGISWEDLEMIGRLPYLQVVQLDSVRGAEWNPIEGQFLSLKALQVRSASDLIHWNADTSHFPVLEFLGLDKVPNLEKIPLEIGDIPTLQRINLDWCKASAANSAMKIVEEQESFGNEGLKVEVSLVNTEFELFKAMLESERKELTTKYFNVRKGFRYDSVPDLVFKKYVG